MINDPAVDVLIRKLGTPEEPVSSYELCVVVAKRTRQIIEQMQNLGTAADSKQKEIVLACQDIINGKVKSLKD